MYSVQLSSLLFCPPSVCVGRLARARARGLPSLAPRRSCSLPALSFFCSPAVVVGGGPFCRVLSYVSPPPIPTQPPAARALSLQPPPHSTRACASSPLKCARAARALLMGRERGRKRAPRVSSYPILSNLNNTICPPPNPPPPRACCPARAVGLGAGAGRGRAAGLDTPRLLFLTPPVSPLTPQRVGGQLWAASKPSRERTQPPSPRWERERERERARPTSLQGAATTLSLPTSPPPLLFLPIGPSCSCFSETGAAGPPLLSTALEATCTPPYPSPPVSAKTHVLPLSSSPLFSS